MLLSVFFLPCLAASEESVVENPNKVEAAFLRNFAHYVTWPNSAFPDSSAPWRIGILGQDPFGDVLENTFKNRVEQERPFEVFRAQTLDELPFCQIIYVAYKDATKRRAILAELKDKPVLTVGEASGFLQEGGIILFHIDGRVAMSINLDQARSVSLTIPGKMLEVSSKIVENGTVRSRK